jgi:hypothetical protein
MIRVLSTALALAMRYPRRKRPSLVLLIGSLVLALGGVARADCPPEFLFGCQVIDASTSFGLLVGNIDGDGVVAFGTNGTGVDGSSVSGYGVSGQSENNVGVYGFSSSHPGVRGDSDVAGVLGASRSGYGVQGTSVSSTGVSGISSSGSGMFGLSTNGGVGVYGESASASGYAGYFNGRVHVNGTLSKAAGSFTIDHPLDPANKTLSHSFVESPDMMNIYNGNTITDAHGNATITLPSYFQALNRDFRYQLTVIEQFAQAMVSSEIQENYFTIKTDKPRVKVSWMVTGVRQDTYANAHRIAVEDEKPAKERGVYLYPEVYGQPKDKGGDHPRRIGETLPMNVDAALQLGHIPTDTVGKP